MVVYRYDIAEFSIESFHYYRKESEDTWGGELFKLLSSGDLDPAKWDRPPVDQSRHDLVAGVLTTPIKFHSKIKKS